MSSGIGNIESKEAGTAARFNSGKPPLSLIPLWIIVSVEVAGIDAPVPKVIDPLWVLRKLGEFQINCVSLPESFEVLTCCVLGLRASWEDCAAVFDYGRQKYAAWNWLKGMPWSAAIDSCARHLLSMSQGVDIDPESGLPHVGHAMCNLVMLMQYVGTYQEGDDRPKLASKDSE